jgi:acetylglutamate kinase
MNTRSNSDLANELLNTFPQLAALKGRRFLVKYGGAAMESQQTRIDVCREIAALTRIGLEIVVVHGGGKEISRLLERLNIPSNFIGGLRQTSPDAMVATEMALSGSINKELSSRITHLGVKAVGISGRDAHLFEATHIKGPNGEDLGATGEIARCEPVIIDTLLKAGYVPVVSPVAETADGAPLNINADYAAAALAGALKVASCVFLTDVDGVKSEGQVQSSLSADEIEKLIANGTISGGMIPKVQCASRAVKAGCLSANICNAGAANIVARALTGGAGAGTRVVGR